MAHQSPYDTRHTADDTASPESPVGTRTELDLFGSANSRSRRGV